MTGSARRSEAWQSWARGLGVAAIGGVFLALAGAFGSGDQSLGFRLAYWVTTMVVGAMVGGTIADQFNRWPGLDDRPLLAGIAMTAAMAVPVTLVVWVMTNLFQHGRWNLVDVQHFLGPVFVVCAVMTALGYLLNRPVQTHAPATPTTPARFLDRMPPKLRGATLRAVQSEDHYLRLHTDRGSDLILMRLADALAELEGIEGAQVHRSWWVARDAVRDVRRGDGRATLTLDGGLEVPVSRRHARTLRATGWW